MTETAAGDDAKDARAEALLVAAAEKAYAEEAARSVPAKAEPRKKVPVEAAATKPPKPVKAPAVKAPKAAAPKIKAVQAKAVAPAAAAKPAKAKPAKAAPAKAPPLPKIAEIKAPEAVAPVEAEVPATVEAPEPPAPFAASEPPASVGAPESPVAAPAPAAKEAPVKPAPAVKPVAATKAPARKTTPKTGPRAIKARPAPAAQNKIPMPAKPVAEAPNTGVTFMTIPTENVVEQIKTAVTEANGRAKAAMEKSAKIVEELAELGRGNIEAFIASSKLAAKGVETMSQDAASYSRKSFEGASATFKSFADVKSPTDFFKLQGDYARSAFDAAVAESARLSESVLKLAGDVAEPLTSRYAVASERVKALAA